MVAPQIVKTAPLRRAICPTCQRPHPRACLCAALPPERIVLDQCRVLVLQHPHEVRRKNRSLFLAEFCLTPESLITVQTRGLRCHDDESVQQLDCAIASLLAPQRSVWLIYPHKKAISLSQALSERQQQQQQQQSTTQQKQPLTLVFLDATWKFAAEMERACQFPSHVTYVALDAKQDLADLDKPKRFDIRTPPSPSHLSTAECLALVVSRVEKNPQIYETIMKPLDLMVSQWHACADQKKEKAARV